MRSAHWLLLGLLWIAIACNRPQQDEPQVSGLYGKSSQRAVPFGQPQPAAQSPVSAKQAKPPPAATTAPEIPAQPQFPGAAESPAEPEQTREARPPKPLYAFA